MYGRKGLQELSDILENKLQQKMYDELIPPIAIDAEDMKKLAP